MIAHELMAPLMFGALVLFMLIRRINKLKKPDPVAPPAPLAPPRQEVLLQEIRDLLAKKQ